MHAMILAAGYGSRFEPQTKFIAKPMLPFLNLPLAAYPLFWLEDVGLERLVVNTHHLAKEVEAGFHALTQNRGYEVTFSREEKILNSGGGLYNVRQAFASQDHLCVANGDSILLLQDRSFFKRAMEYHINSGAVATLLVCEHPNPGKDLSGVWMNDESEVAGFGKKEFKGARSLHFTGFYFFSKEIFSFLSSDPTNLIHDNLNLALKKGAKVMAMKCDPCLWFEVGNEPSFIEATKQCLSHMKAKDHYGFQLLEIFKSFGVGNHLEEFDGNLVLSPHGADAPAGLSLKGFLVMGDAVSFEDGCNIEDCVVLSGSKIKAKSYFQQAIVPGSE